MKTSPYNPSARTKKGDMLYFSLSPEKLALLLGIAAILFVLIIATFSYKRSLYGGTPFFPATGLFISEQLHDMAYGIGQVVRAPFNGAGALWALMAGGEPHKEAPKRNARAIPVLTYHRVVTGGDERQVNIKNFSDQMRKLKAAGWQTVTVADYVAYMKGGAELPEKSFVITFDDGAKDSFYPVDPIFRELGYNGAIYVIVKSSNVEESVYYLSPAELERMLETGRWEIGSHSYDAHHSYPVDQEGTEGNFYADLLWRPGPPPGGSRLETPAEFRARVRDDMERSKRELEERYGIIVDTFAFPLGETGAVTANNFPGGIPITDEEAARVYEYGFLQTHGDDFTFNYREYPDFFSKRIHVDYDWDGDRLLAIMEGGNPKDIPFTDDFDTYRGWIAAWGEVLEGDGFLQMRTPPERTSVEALLDGTVLWKEYRYEATLDWRDGYALLLTALEGSEVYRACAFAEGQVQIQSQNGAERTVWARGRDASIAYGEHVRVGTRTNGTDIDCLYNGQVVLSFSGLSERVGGIGIQAWDERPGTAELIVKHVEVTPYDGASR